MEPDISPLAKRLAEENNVNWRGLGGSGANGRIVERDVLEYLAKVMAGEEDLNPTAEPVPEGMEAWPEEDTAGYFSESPSIKASDTLTEVVTEMPSVSVGEASDVFAFDDEPSDLEPDPVVMSDSEAMFTDLDTGLDTGLDGSSDSVDDIANTFSQDQNEVSDVHISEDIFLFDESGTSAEDDGFASFGESEKAIPDVSIDEVTAEVGASSAEMESETQSAFETGLENPADDIADSDADVAADFEMEDSADFSDVPTADAVEAQPVETETDAYEADNTPGEAEELFASAEEEHSDEPALFSDDLGSEEATHDDTLLEPIAATIEPVASESDNGDSGANVIESETLTPVAPLTSADLPLSSFGIMLRRHTDLGAAMSAQLAISHELGHSDEPIALSYLLVRAAAKALQRFDIANGQGVGLALFEDDGVHVASVTGAHDASFKVLVEQLSKLDAHGGTPTGLAVADMSDLGVDEAVLNLDVPVLALGRILQDSEQASQRSTLTLSGNVPVEAGTQFLSAVAELLASPIRLVL